MRTPTLAVRVQLPLWWNSYVLFNTDILNFAWKTDEAESILLIFILWRWAVEWGCKSYLGPAEIVSFSSRSFSHLNIIWLKCETPLLFFLLIIYYISFHQQKYLLCFSCQISKMFNNTFFKEHLRWLLLYILYTHDVTCNLSRWNHGYNGNYKKDQKS